VIAVAFFFRFILEIV